MVIPGKQHTQVLLPERHRQIDRRAGSAGHRFAAQHGGCEATHSDEENSFFQPERDVIVEALVSLVTDYKDPSDPMQKTKRSTYEKVIDEILRYAYSEGALGLK